MGGVSVIDLVNYSGSTNYNFKVVLDNLTILSPNRNYSVSFIENSDVSNSKGNIYISNCRLSDKISFLPITFSNSLRYKHISILNNSVLSTSILYPVDLEDTSNYLINNDIKILHNTLYTNSLGYRQDRVGYDLFVPNNLTVAGDINVLGDLNVSDASPATAIEEISL